MTESNPTEYVEWALALLRRWRTQGVEMPYFSILNEPGYVRSGIWSGQWIRDVTKLLGAKLEADGFSTKLVVPDDLNPRKRCSASRSSWLIRKPGGTSARSRTTSTAAPRVAAR
jgi:hypothetical protein